MRTIGRFTTLLAATLVAALGVLGVRSIPDIKRYLQIRRM